MAALWSSALNEQFMGAMVNVNDEGSGTITASVEWPDGLRDELTRRFAACINELWSALDSLITETVQLFSSSRTPRDQDVQRYWPTANSQENLELLLAQACINGVLRTHADIVLSTQPFLPDSEIEQIQRIQKGMRQLLTWTEALDAGANITVWATPINPTVSTEPNSEGIECIPGSSFDLGSRTEGVVADFRVPAYQRGMRVFGRPGTLLDLGFAADFVPVQADDTLDSRLREVLEVVILLHAHFASVSGKVRGIRALPIESLNRDDLWRSASESPRLWEQSELAGLTETGARVAVVIDPNPSELVLLVPTEDGVFEPADP
ncbi:hypothetical protein GCM10027404_33030 [Arthrobacter tumbae]